MITLKPENFPRTATSLLIVLAVALISLAYWPGLSGGFIFDDIGSIVSNIRIHADTITWRALTRAANGFDPNGSGRSIAMVSFAINHALGGLDPWGYKLGNLLLHLVNTVLIFFLVKRVLNSTGNEGARSSFVAVFLAVLWAAHPLQVSTVLYAVQRMEILSLTFVLAALLCYLQGRKAQMDGKAGWPWLLSCVPLATLGALGKETAVLLPLYTFALELTVLGFVARRETTARALKWLYLIVGVIAVLVFIGVIWPKYSPPSAYFSRDFTVAERLLTQLRVLPMHIGQILLPLPGSMTFYYDDLVISRNLFSPVTTVAGGLLIAMLLLAAVTLRRRLPLFSLGIFWFFGAHALTSNIIPLELVFEHRNYFALLGLLIAAYDLLRRIPLKVERNFQIAIIASLAIGLLFLTFIRSSIWGDRLLFATQLVDGNPNSERASTGLGAMYLEMTDGYPNSPFYDFALREFERGSTLPTASVFSDQGLILAAAVSGRKVEDQWWDRMVERLRTDTIRPEVTSAMFGLLQNRYENVELDDERLTEAFLTLFSRATLSAVSYAQFGDYLLKYTSDEALAEQMFVTAVERSVDHPEYAEQIVTVLLKEGHERQAAAALCRADQLGLVDASKFEFDISDCDVSPPSTSSDEA